MKTFSKHIILLTLLLSLTLAGCNKLVSPVEPNEIIPEVQSISKYLVDNVTMEKKKLVFTELYNKSGKIEKYLQYDENQNLIQVNNITYTKTSTLEITVNISAKGDTLNKIKTETVYNSIGNVEYKNIYDSSGDTVKKIIFSYDTYNNVNKKETIDLITGKTDVVSYKLTYNNMGQVVKREAYSNGQLTNQQAYSYSTDNGAGVTIKSSENLIEKTIQYNFNEYGKIISEYHLDSSGKILSVYKYFYTYYNL